MILIFHTRSLWSLEAQSAQRIFLFLVSGDLWALFKTISFFFIELSTLCPMTIQTHVSKH